jgi:hypothetical protein
MSSFYALAAAYLLVGLVAGLLTQGHALQIIHRKIHRKDASSCLVDGSHRGLVSLVLLLLLLASSCLWPLLMFEHLHPRTPRELEQDEADDEDDDSDPPSGAHHA